MTSASSVEASHSFAPSSANSTTNRNKPEQRYSKGELIGHGAFKKVYKAYDAEEGREVAWNQVKLGNVKKQQREKILGEISILQQVQHERIMSIYDSWESDDGNYLVFITEIMSSGTLKDFLNKAKKIKLRNVKRWSKQILEGLIYLHTQFQYPVIHRDLKCENIFIHGSRSEVKIGDLGLSIYLKDKQYAVSVIGTPQFMAPELYEESYTEAVDIYALGMCVLEMVTGDYPYSECSNAAQVYRRVTHGIKPKALENIQDELTKEFIKACLSSVDSRPSAVELLNHPFFLSSKNDDVTLYFDNNDFDDDFEEGTPLPSDEISQPKQIESFPKPDDSDRILVEKHPSAEPVTETLAHGDSGNQIESFHSSEDNIKYARVVVDGETTDGTDSVTLKLFFNVKGSYKQIRFPYNRREDTPGSVAVEMAKQLDLNDRDRERISLGIAKTIEDIENGTAQYASDLPHLDGVDDFIMEDDEESLDDPTEKDSFAEETPQDQFGENKIFNSPPSLHTQEESPESSQNHQTESSTHQTESSTHQEVRQQNNTTEVEQHLQPEVSEVALSTISAESLDEKPYTNDEIPNIKQNIVEQENIGSSTMAHSEPGDTSSIKEYGGSETASVNSTQSLPIRLSSSGKTTATTLHHFDKTKSEFKKECAAIESIYDREIGELELRISALKKQKEHELEKLRIRYNSIFSQQNSTQHDQMPIQNDHQSTHRQYDEIESTYPQHSENERLHMNCSSNETTGTETHQTSNVRDQTRPSLSYANAVAGVANYSTSSSVQSNPSYGAPVHSLTTVDQTMTNQLQSNTTGQNGQVPYTPQSVAPTTVNTISNMNGHSSVVANGSSPHTTHDMMSHSQKTRIFDISPSSQPVPRTMMRMSDPARTNGVTRPRTHLVNGHSTQNGNLNESKGFSLSGGDIDPLNLLVEDLKRDLRGNGKPNSMDDIGKDHPQRRLRAQSFTPQYTVLKKETQHVSP